MPEVTDELALSSAFLEALRAEHDSMNQRYALRLRAGAKIDDAAFMQHLRSTVNLLVSNVATQLPERVRTVANALFDVSLDLFAAGLLGSATKHPHVVRAWRDVLPFATRLLARDPLRVAGCLSNAVDYLAGYPLARPKEWIERMRDLSPDCDSVALWLDAGKVVAWRAGLVQCRSAALRLMRELPSKMAKRCVGAPQELSEADWRACVERLESDRWFSPTAPASNQASVSLQIVRTTGGFRGFGGPCLRPPTVKAIDGKLFAYDGHASWELLADQFGTLWHRIPTVPTQLAAQTDRCNIKIDSAGRVDWNGTQRQFVELAEASSFACDGQTLAVALPTSHHVFLVAQVAA